MQTAVSRSILCIPLLFPGVVFFGLERARLMPTRFWPKCFVEGLVFFIELYFAVPFGVAYYPQYATLHSSKVEEDLRKFKNKEGIHVENFIYNKGL